VAVSGTWLGLTPAAADEVGAQRGPGLVSGQGQWEGAYQFQSGKIGWCFSPDRIGPQDVVFNDPEPVTAWVNDQGVPLSPRQLNALGYVLSVYGVPGLSDETATAVRFVVYDIGGYTSIGGAGVVPAGSSYDLGDPASYGSVRASAVGVRDLALAIKSEAFARANSWDGTGSLTTNTAGRDLSPGDGATATVWLPGLGAGQTVTFELTHPDTTITVHDIVTADDSTATFTYSVPRGEPGLYGIWAHIESVPAAHPSIATPRGHVQTIIMGSAERRSWEAPERPAFRVRFQPTATTHTSAQLVIDRTSLFDTIGVAGGPPGEGFSGQTSLYGPFPTDQAAQGADLSGAEPVGTAAFSGTYGQDGTATVRSKADVAVEQPGFYVWVEHIDETPNGLPFEPGRAGRAPETTVLVQPSVRSEASVNSGAVGDQVTDTVTVAGLQATVGGGSVEWTLKGGLFGPVAPGPDQTCATADWTAAGLAVAIEQPVDPATLTSDGTAQLSGLGPFMLDHPYTCYSYAYTLAGAAPDGSTVTVRHPIGQPAQTVLVRYSPSASTKVSTQLLVADGQARVSDTIHVRDGVPDLPFTGTTALFGPFETNEAALAADLGAQEPVGSVSFGGVYGPDGQAVVVSPELTVDEQGFYVFVESLDATWASQPAPATIKNRPPETTVVLDVAITSQVSDTVVAPGRTVTDDVLLSGLVPMVGASPVTYALRGGLFGPMPADPALTCDSVTWSKAPMVSTISETIPPAAITKDGTLALRDLGPYVIPPEPRGVCYSYGYALTSTTASGATVTVEHPPGDPAQTLLVPAPHTVEPPAVTVQPPPDKVEPPPPVPVHGVIVAGEALHPPDHRRAIFGAALTMAAVFVGGRRWVARLDPSVSSH
jgi:hypothetical protein